MPLIDLLCVEKPPERCSSVVDISSQVLDHIVVNLPLIKQFTGVDILNLNSGYLDFFGREFANTKQH